MSNGEQGEGGNPLPLFSQEITMPRQPILIDATVQSDVQILYSVINTLARDRASEPSFWLEIQLPEANGALRLYAGGRFDNVLGPKSPSPSRHSALFGCGPWPRYGFSTHRGGGPARNDEMLGPSA